jgi:hypothetical protein
MRMRISLPVASVSLLLLAACSRTSEMDADLKRDLDAASAGNIELAPSGAKTNVVSAIESKQPLQPKVTPVRQTKAPAKTPRPETPQVTQTGTPATGVSAEPTAQRPLPASSVQPAPPGGYKTMGQVIRQAPFPINPATKKP